MRKILFISTEPHVLDDIRSDLQLKGFEIFVHEPTAGLLLKIQDFTPDLLIMDFILNDTNAGGLCHQLKSDPKTAHFPVIILSDMPQLNRFSTKFGCNIILYKPINKHDLIRQVVTLTQASALQ